MATSKIVLSKSEIPLGAALTCGLVQQNFEFGEKTFMEIDASCSFTKSHSISRHIARLHPDAGLYPSNILNRTEVDNWLTLTGGPAAIKGSLESFVTELNSALQSNPFLVGKSLTIADLEAFGVIYQSKQLLDSSTRCKMTDWFDRVEKKVQRIMKTLPLPEVKNPGKKTDEGGKFASLPGAEKGKVVVRFPPEASGYLHIGHAKAALLNQYYQKEFEGKLIMRFDDTNPAKENAEFEKVILEDLKLLQIEPDMYTHTSDLFPKMLELCENLIGREFAYADDTDAETMKKEREERKNSKNRDNSVEKNLKMWNEMKGGTEYGQKCCIRAKMDMSSPNGCLRDPTIYRCKTESHVRTGTEYKAYPTYDFACPIVDSIEGVTHALRTTEYHDRDDQYKWFIEKLDLRPVVIYDYSRLNMNNTVLSKRKLTWFVQEGLVDGWDDPRFPTVRGILRRGMTVEGLKEFIISQGSSRSVVNMEWDKIWAFNKKVIDREASRYTALEGDLIPVIVANATVETKDAQKHPKDPSKGLKQIWMGPKVYIESVDAILLKEGENATFINWGNLMIKKVIKSGDKVTSVEAETNLSNTDFRKTLKLTWLAETDVAPWTPLVCVYFDHIISKGVLAKDEDFKQFIGQNTRNEITMVGDNELKNIKAGDIIQLQRKGFFRIDKGYSTGESSSESSVIAFYIPDGHTKENINVVKPIGSKTVPGKNKGIEESSKKDLSSVVSAKNSNTGMEIHDKIKRQGDKIRDLKASKAEKSSIKVEVDILLNLKKDFKNATGQDWKPDIIGKLDLSENQGNKLSNTKDSEIISSKPSAMENVSGIEIHDNIKKQGDKIRDLKASKADKNVIKGEVSILLDLKKDFKNATGKDWKPDIVCEKVDLSKEQSNNTVNPSAMENVTVGENAVIEIHDKIKKQGDKIRDLKTSKGEKSIIKVEVDILLELKKDFKKSTGKDWKPDVVAEKVQLSSKQGEQSSISKDSPILSDNLVNPSAMDNVTSSDNGGIEIIDKIKKQGDKIRDLKASKADKNIIKGEVTILLDLKKDFKDTTGKDWKPDISNEKVDLSKKQGDKVSTSKDSQIVSGSHVNPSLGDKLQASKTDMPAVNISSAKEVSSKSAKNVKNKNKEGESQGKKLTRLCVETKKLDNLAEWYSQVIIKSEMADYYNVSGCYILRPWSYAIWDNIKNFIDVEIAKMGVENCYFPMFISKDMLEKEKSHIADFSPEVAWVTKCGSTDMAEPIAIRPTSETVIYPAVAKWIQSHRDLPLKLNQWSNVVRWEFKQPTPFLRTREFLWQEGHTAFATEKEAVDDVNAALEVYRRVYEELLAIPVIKGRKTDKERFAGAVFTMTVEALVTANGRAIQGATSHHLGQNFSKMFEVSFDDPETNELKYAYQNSWGLTTRTLGVMIMIHGDDKGLVLPPRVAKIQVVIVPVGITAKTSVEEKLKLIQFCHDVSKDCSGDIRSYCDDKENVTPGWKFNHWELKGVPMRIEIGPKEMSSENVCVVRRDTGEKLSLPRKTIKAEITSLIDTIHNDMYDRAKIARDNQTATITEWAEFLSNLDQKKIIMSPFCGEEHCEVKIKQSSAREGDVEPGAPSMGAKTLCIPSVQPRAVDGLSCIYPSCSNKAQFFTLFGRSY